MTKTSRGERSIDKAFMLFWVLLIWRIANSLITKTYFQADEFWQALEPAHRMAFGYGSLTWEWEEGLRSYAFPFIFEMVYYCAIYIKNMAQWSGLDVDLNKLEYSLVIYLPKIVMALIAATGEYFTCHLVKKLYQISYEKSESTNGRKQQVNILKIAAVLTMTNFFNGFFITRTFINSFEMTLTAISLYYWNWNGIDMDKFSFQVALFLAIFTCLQRPSNGIIWIVLGCSLLWNLYQNKKYNSGIRLLGYVMRNLVLALILNCTIDYYFYQELVFPIFKFVKFNFTTPLSQFYGVAPWHFHIFQSVPILLGYNILAFFYGMVMLQPKRSPFYKISPLQTVKLSIVINLIIYSCLPHKEFRFIYPLQPLFAVISTLGFLKLFEFIPKVLCYAVPLVTVMLFVVVDYYHESGSISVVKYLHNIPEIKSLGFIMPCHSTPGQSYLHRQDISDLWAISCKPPLNLLEDENASLKLATYMDESDYLYYDIPSFFNKYFADFRADGSVISTEFDRKWPEYLVTFEHLEDNFLKNYFKTNQLYQEEKRFFNSLSHWDSRRAGDIIIYKKTTLS